MLELDNTLSRRLTGKDAVVQRARVLLGLQPTDIPYYEVGLDRTVFSYDSPKTAIQQALKSMNPIVTVDGEGKTRVIVANVDLNLTELLGEEE